MLEDQHKETFKSVHVKLWLLTRVFPTPTIDMSTTPFTVEDVYTFEDDFEDEDYDPEEDESDSSDSEDDSDDESSAENDVPRCYWKGGTTLHLRMMMMILSPVSSRDPKDPEKHLLGCHLP